MELTDIEKEAIHKFLAARVMYDAVKKVLFEEVKQSIKIDYNNNNEHIGSQMRARQDAEQLLKVGFSQLERYRKVEEKPKKVNQSR